MTKKEYQKQWRLEHKDYQRLWRERHPVYHKLYARKQRFAKGIQPKKQTNSKFYWQPEMDDYIVEFNSTTKMAQRNLIYETKLKDPLEKMAENIFNTFKFTYWAGSAPKDIMKDAVSYMVEKLYCYDKTKSKSFSFCSVVMKYWFIQHNNRNYKHLKNTVSIVSIDQEDIKPVETMKIDPAYSSNMDYTNLDYLRRVWDDMYSYYSTFTPTSYQSVWPRYMKVLNAINDILIECNVYDGFRTSQAKTKTIYADILKRCGLERKTNVTEIGHDIRRLFTMYMKAKYKTCPQATKRYYGKGGKYHSLAQARELFVIHKNAEVVDEAYEYYIKHGKAMPMVDK
jgi:hypothetical protein